MYNKRIHITPDDVLADIDEHLDGSDPRSRCKYFIEPYGVHSINEVCEANYYAGNRVMYHEHRSGFETFLVDGGAIEILYLNRKAVARNGDIVHFSSYMPHSIHTLEDNSIWRAFHQGLWFVAQKIEENNLRDRHWDLALSSDFRRVNNERRDSIRYDYELPECIEVPANELQCLRQYDFALADYCFDGISLKLKVGRWETNGAKEVWQLRLKSGYTLSWNEQHPFSHLYDVFSGSVRVTLEGMEPFTAHARDLLHIPRLLAGKIEALEDVVLLDAGCQGYLTRFMDAANSYKVKAPEKLKDSAFICELMAKYDYHVLFETL